MKKLVLIFGMVILSLTQSFATVYYACGTGINWNGSTSFVYTASNCSGGAVNPNTLTSADEMVIQAGAVITVVGNITLNAIKLTIYGTLYIHTPSVAGKLTMPNTSATLVLQSGSVLACTNDGVTEASCSPASSSQIIVGSGANKYQYKGGDIDVADSFPKPSTLDNTGGPLPVELLFFKAGIRDSEISLDWATASELNFDHFSIERSTDGKSFGEIGQAEGHGTTNESNHYSFVDCEPIIGTIYYRLKTVDVDGYTEYSNIESVHFSQAKSFVIYPNPVSSNTIGILLNFEAQQGSEIIITDLNGVQVYNCEFYEAGNRFTIPLALDPGTYIIRIKDGDYTDVKRVVFK